MPQPTHQYDWPPSSDHSDRIFDHFCQLFEHWLFWVSLITQVSVVARCCSWTSSSSTACCAQKLSAWRENKIKEKTTSWSGKWFAAKVTLPKTNSSPLKTMLSNNPFPGVYFQVRTVSFRESISLISIFQWMTKIFTGFSKHHFSKKKSSSVGIIPPFPTNGGGMLPSWSLTCSPWKYAIPQKERIVFQPSFFRGELLVLGRVSCSFLPMSFPLKTPNVSPTNKAGASGTAAMASTQRRNVSWFGWRAAAKRACAGVKTDGNGDNKPRAGQEHFPFKQNHNISFEEPNNLICTATWQHVYNKISKCIYI